MNFIQEFCAWWYVNIFDPYGQFVFVEHLEWACILTAVVLTVFLGVFYKPGDPFYSGTFMEKWGFPLLTIGFGSMLLPLLSVLLMLVMPAILVFVMGLGGLMLLYIGIRKMRETYEESLRDQLHRLEQERRAERNPGDKE